MHVYWFQDSKVGHLKQVQALLDEIAKEINFTITKLHCANRNIYGFFQPLSKLILAQNTNDQPVLLIGAGHSTYPNILRAQRLLKKNTNAFSVAILKPSFNSNAFDLICAPEHDYPKQFKANNVFTFKGSLAATSFAEPIDNKGIIAVGGSSKHYAFDNSLVAKQIEYILTSFPHHHFNIFNTRRTPKSLNKIILKMSDNFHNFAFIEVDSPLAGSFQDDVATSELKFVTPDSSNLVFEALSSKGKTYLMQIERLGRFKLFGSNKIRVLIGSLVSSRQVGTIDINAMSPDLNIHKIEHPMASLEPMAEVEKTSYAILNLLLQKK